MIKYTAELTLGMDIFDFSVELNQDTCFKIEECFYHNSHLDEFGRHIYVTTYINQDEECEDDVDYLSSAIKRIKLSNSIMSFLYGFYFESEFIGIDWIREVEMIEEKEYLGRSENEKRIEQFQKLYLQLNNEQKTEFIKCCKLFSNAVYVAYKYEFYEDSSLNLIKLLEIISRKHWSRKVNGELRIKIKTQFEELLSEYMCEEYEQSIHKHQLTEIINNYNNLINLKQKLTKFCKDKNIDVNSHSKIEDPLNKLVKLRNAVAHGNELNLSHEEMLDLFITGLWLALEFISINFFEMEYKSLGLNKSIELES